MVWRRLGGVLFATSALFLLLACSGSGLAIRQGYLRPPDINLLVSRHPLIGMISTTMRCRALQPRDPRMYRNYIVLLYRPAPESFSGSTGKIIIDVSLPC